MAPRPAPGAAPVAPPDPDVVRTDAQRAIAEDFGHGDVTADLLPREAAVRAQVVCREPAVIAGADWFDACYTCVDATVRVHWQVRDGERAAADTVVCEVTGPARAVVGGERAALNFLQTLSATATATARFVDAVAGTRAVILDTRKTLPGLRHAQKYAVRCGGGSNHRLGLYDAVLVKENHIAAAGSIAAVVGAARRLHPALPVIVEAESIDEMEQAIAAGADRVMLDDFSPDALREAVRRCAGRVPLEVSGGVDLDRVRAIADTGVDFISIGAITKHVRAIDFSMRVVG